MTNAIKTPASAVAGSIETTTVDRQAKPTISRFLFECWKHDMDLRGYDIIEPPKMVIVGTRDGFMKRPATKPTTPTTPLAQCLGTAKRMIGDEQRTVAIIANGRLGIRWGLINSTTKMVTPMGTDTSDTFEGAAKLIAA